ncbi:FAD-binding oxidoreductase [Marinilongibacter aquaticus]|uniref:NAD(P)/FAD-dependent oxidoreductase n=1 Tax=Marinilongibacter aquaticus TaxID=2975157 RepID=UPI0021BD5D4F|nr:FAD-binding oxidoreductase [Marinilongibacter aquaticus]UBM60487.1 FAD-binding oxidoreductase [Marinilongibacter aquaticus]
MIDFLIIGQGLAGTTLAHHLLERKQKIALIHSPTKTCSSLVAGGMFNPVTGKHLAKTWLVDQLFPKLKTFYRQIEAQTGENLLFEIPIYRPFKNENQQNQFIKAIEKHGLQELCEIRPPSNETNIENPLGGILTKMSGRLDVPKYLQASAQLFANQGILIEDEFQHDLLQIGTENIEYKEIRAKHIIFCEGNAVENNPFFNALPFNPVKGETLEVEFEEPLSDWIINQGKWLMPLGEKRYKAGSTYVWHELNNRTSEEGRQQIQEGIRQFIKKDFRILKQEAGVRPATKTRRPFLGAHPKYKALYIFNGLGTKGVSLAPFFAENLTNHLLEGKELYSETTIGQYYALY